MFTHNNKPPLLRNLQRLVDKGEPPNVPIVYRQLPQTNGGMRIDVLGCLIQDGDEVTLGSNWDPEKQLVDITLAHKVDSNGKPIHISHHACSIKRRDDGDKACLWIEGNESQEQSKKGRVGVFKLKAIQYIWKKGKLTDSVDIGRLWHGSCKKSVISKLDPSRRKTHTTGIEVTHGDDVLDQIFIGVHPKWTPLFENEKYMIGDDNWYRIPPGMEGVPSSQEVEDSQLTQKSAGSLSLPPNVALQFSQLSVQEEEGGEKKTDPIFRNGGLTDDPVKMLSEYLQPQSTSDDYDDDTQLPTKPSQGADLDIFKIMGIQSEDDSVDSNNKDRGSLYEVAAGFLALKSVKQYVTKHGPVYRQHHRPNQALHSINPFGDLLARIKREANVEFRSDNDYFIGDSTLSAKEVRTLALGLAPSYEEEFIVLFGSEEEYQKQLRKLKTNDDVDYESLPLMITVIARALLCAVVLHLPDKKDPLYFYPYPMGSGIPSPQHGDYQRPMMNLTLWTDGRLSLLMPIGYEEGVHVDITKSRITEKSQEKKQDSQDNAKKSKRREKAMNWDVTYLKEKKGTHYVEKNGEKLSRPVISVFNYYADEEESLADIIAEVNQTIMPALKEHVRKTYPRVEGIIYDISVIEQDLADRGYFRYRNKSPAIPSRSPAYYMSAGLGLPISYHSKIDPCVTEVYSGKKIVTYESVMDYRDESISRLHDLTNNELKEKMKSARMEGFLDTPDPVNFPTMRKAAGKLDLWHSTGMQPSNGQLLVLDLNYIRCIDKDRGPYKDEANSGAQISGEDWYNALTLEDKKIVRALHLKYCHLPPWMIPESAHRAVSKHFTKMEDLYSQCVYGGTSFGMSHYFHRFKDGRYPYGSGSCFWRHATWRIPCSVTKEIGFAAVGMNMKGCEQLGRAFLPYQVEEVAEVTYDNPETFLMESGCKLTKVMEGGKFCVPAEVHIKEEGKTRVQRHEEIVNVVVAKAKKRSKSSGKKPKSKKRASYGKKKDAESQEDIDDLCDEMPKPKKRTKKRG